MKPLRDIFHMPLVHGRFEIDLMKAIFKLNLVIDGRGVSCYIPFRWVSLDLSGDKLLMWIMAWCHEATGHNLN